MIHTCAKPRDHPAKCFLDQYMPRPLEACLTLQQQLIRRKHGSSGCFWLNVFTHTHTHYFLYPLHSLKEKKSLNFTCFKEGGVYEGGGVCKRSRLCNGECYKRLKYAYLH